MHQAHKVTLAFVCSKAPIEEADNQILIASALKVLLEDSNVQLSNEEIERIFEMCLECLNNLHSQSNE